MDKFIAKSFEETQQAGAELARKVLRGITRKALPADEAGALVLALNGDLGAGKTTFLQGFAKGLGIDEVVNSPTFIIIKKFEISNDIASFLRPQKRRYRYFYHFDLYRLETEKDLDFLNIKEIISDPKNIVAIEWPEKIANLLPKNAIKITFSHLQENEREIVVE